MDFYDRECETCKRKIDPSNYVMVWGKFFCSLICFLNFKFKGK